MVFASLTFLYLFLPLNLILYYLSGNKIYRNTLLTVFSFIFYAWGEPLWIILLIFTASVDYMNALFIEKFRGTPRAKIFLVASILLNLGLFAIFKYSDFVVDNINAVFSLSLERPGFALPIGISFYVFQTLSYTVDVYKGEVKAQPSYLNFMLFVSLYHQLVAGPIVRYAHIAHEIDYRKFDLTGVSEGITRFCIGLFKKVCISNVAAEILKSFIGTERDPLDLHLLSFSEGWYSILLFSIHIYFDFSGYSDMAIGLGKMFGFHYHENFLYPYIAKSATDFWRRWHISLGTFFRDYVYIPLGGNKHKPYRNLFIVWMLTGLWHGASWNFVIWGMYFGVLIFIERIFLFKFMERLPAFLSHLYLLFAVMMGWVMFQFTDMHRMTEFFGILFARGEGGWINDAFVQVFFQNIYWLMIALILCLPVYPFFKERIRAMNKNPQFNYAGTMMIACNMAMLIVSSALLVGVSYNPFIYNRF